MIAVIIVVVVTGAVDVGGAVVVVIAVVDAVTFGRTVFYSFAIPLQAPAAHSTVIQATAVPITRPIFFSSS